MKIISINPALTQAAHKVAFNICCDMDAEAFARTKEALNARGYRFQMVLRDAVITITSPSDYHSVSREYVSAIEHEYAKALTELQIKRQHEALARQEMLAEVARTIGLPLDGAGQL